jgi:hypothetical protein
MDDGARQEEGEDSREHGGGRSWGSHA